MRNRILAIAAIAGVLGGVPIAAQAQSDAVQAPRDVTVGVAPCSTLLGSLMLVMAYVSLSDWLTTLAPVITSKLLALASVGKFEPV